MTCPSLRRKIPGVLVVGWVLLMVRARNCYAAPADYFAIHVVDDQTGRGVPLVSLQTTYKAQYVTDSNGYVAFNEPGLMDGGHEVWFEVASAGYESPQRPEGVRGVAFKITPGGTGEIRLRRTNIAERLYRMTGYGIYRDTILLGKQPPIAEGLLNAQVTGQDTVQSVVFRNKYYWFWQDTDQLSFGLGNFSMTGATAAMPERLNLDKGIDFTYFADKPGGFVRAMAHIPREDHLPIWIDGLIAVKDEQGVEQMLGRYFVANRDFSPAEAGLAIWNSQKEVFERLKVFDRPDALTPSGHPVHVRVGGQNYLYCPSPFALVRVKDDFATASDPGKYEALTCVKPGGSYSKDHPDLNRVGGKLVWMWQQNAHPAGPNEVKAWIEAGLVTLEETPYQLRDVESGKPITAAGGSIAWNPYLKKWTMLFTQLSGTSNLGEVWWSTANSPEGPWRDARKVATHAKKNDNNDFYNPLQHDELMRGNGRYVYFEGTFVNTFSGNPHQTPLYDYNNIMYRLDVADTRMKLPDPPAGLSDARPLGE